MQVMVKDINKEENKISFTYKELLGTWEDNIKEFKQGTVVTRNSKGHREIQKWNIY